MTILFGLILVGITLAMILMLRERSMRRTRLVPPGLQSDISLPFEAEWTLYHNPFSLCSKQVSVW